MVVYPIYVPRQQYRGRDMKRMAKVSARNAIALELETHINRCIEECCNDVQVYYYSKIASETGHGVDTVRALLFSVDGGYNGMTVAKFQEALEKLFKTGESQGGA